MAEKVVLRGPALTQGRRTLRSRSTKTGATESLSPSLRCVCYSSSLSSQPFFSSLTASGAEAANATPHVPSPASSPTSGSDRLAAANSASPSESEVVAGTAVVTGMAVVAGTAVVAGMAVAARTSAAVAGRRIELPEPLVGAEMADARRTAQDATSSSAFQFDVSD